jgi:drug/metabolite transporter (DMT)-like permease
MGALKYHQISRGILWMLAQTFCMCGMMACVRQLSLDGFGGPQLVFFRAAAGLIVLIPWLTKTSLSEPEILLPKEFWFLLLRGFIALCGVLGWFIALTGLSISDVVAIQFTYPLFVVVGAAFVLREHVTAPRWIAVFIGFSGALIVIRPGLVPFDPLIIGVLISAFSNATVQLITKYFSLRVSGAVMIFYMNIVMAIGSLVICWSSWIWPDWSHLGWILAIGASGTLAHIFLARGMRMSDASLLGPVDFLRLPIGAFIGWVLFKEFSDVWTWVGAAVIFASVASMARLERSDKDSGK